MIHVSFDHLKNKTKDLLITNNVRKYIAFNISEGLCQASLRGVDSHGIRLLPHYYKVLNNGRLNKNPTFDLVQNSNSTAILDADHAPGHASGTKGMLKAIDLAKNNGVGAVSVKNSSHFGAAAYFSLRAAKENMIGLSFTNATAHVTPFKGKTPFFGNNPICICAPVEDEEPFCLDMATTKTTFNALNKYKEDGLELPDDHFFDKNGMVTTEIEKAFSLIPIGKYKGFGLSMMVEILCGLLSDMPTGPNVTPMFDEPISNKRYIAHFFLALNIASFIDPNNFKKKIKIMMDDLRSQKSNDSKFSIMCPGDPEKKIKETRLKKGIPISTLVFDEINELFVNSGLTKLNSIGN